MSIFDLIHNVEKYAPIARFLIKNRDEEVDLAKTGDKAVVAIEKSDPTIIPHLEALTTDLVKKAGAPPVAEGENVNPPHVVAKHIIARAIVSPSTISADERNWMDRASQSD
jgi:hypothetical protein